MTFRSQSLEDLGNTVPVVRLYAGPRDASRASDVSQRENTGHEVPAFKPVIFPHVCSTQTEAVASPRQTDRHPHTRTHTHILYFRTCLSGCCMSSVSPFQSFYSPCFQGLHISVNTDQACCILNCLISSHD